MKKGKNGAGHTGFSGRSTMKKNAAQTSKLSTSHSERGCEKMASRTGAVACTGTDDPNMPHNSAPYGSMPNSY